MKTPPPVPCDARSSAAATASSPGRVASSAKGRLSENIEVEGSHCGLGHNPAVLYAIADRLAQPEGAWRPFERSGLKGLIYPDPHRTGSWSATARSRAAAPAL